MYKERRKDLNLELGEVRDDNSLSFDGRGERERTLKREGDLIQNDLLWFCSKHVNIENSL